MERVKCIVFITWFVFAIQAIFAQETCKNIYEDYSCKKFKALSMCRMFRKYCHLTCGVCSLPKPTPKEPPTTPKWEGKWTECTKTCGCGTRYRFTNRRCTNENNPRCGRRFEECNTFPCPLENCPSHQAPRYGYRKGCCNQVRDKPYALDRGLNSRDSKATWPWLVLVTAFRDVCGGALIHKKWVLTAAHCVTSGNVKLSVSGIHVYVGINNIRDANRRNMYRVRRTVVHQRYNDAQDDIALIELYEEVWSIYTAIIELPRGEVTPIDSTCVVMGWDFAEEVSSTMQHVDQQILDFGICRNHFRSDSEFSNLVTKRSPKLMCAGGLSKRNPICNSNTGSLLVCQRCSSCHWYIAGLTTLVRRDTCDLMGYPTIFTGIRSHESWICRNVRGLNTRAKRCPYKYGP